jgi:STE24 endopeptidase
MEQLVIGLFLLFFICELLIELALNELNLAHVRASSSAGHMPAFIAGKMTPAEYDKSVQYTLAKGYFQRYSEFYGGAVTLVILFGGLLPLCDGWARRWASFLPWLPYADGVLFCLGVVSVHSLALMPLSLYATFVLESRFGFNKTTWRLYLMDRLKGIILAVLLGVPFIVVLLAFIQNAGPYWWVWTFLFATAFQFVLLVAYPIIIAPWFNKFQPLAAGPLRDGILALAQRVDFKTSGIFTMDGSKRSGHSNAYFTGIGKAKRIVLFDTLLEQMTIDQGLAVLAHEMGHYTMKHIRRMLVVQLICLFIALYLLSLLMDYRPFFNAFGLSPSGHAALVLFALVSGPATFYLSPVLNRLSRRHEYEADRFAAVTLGDVKPMEEALINLTARNLTNLTPHPWYSAYHYTHPSTEERIHALRETGALAQPH